jgi:hypothetical protein
MGSMSDMGTSQQRHGATFATANDAEPGRLTAAEIAQVKRSNREQRRREGHPPTTARDDALTSVASYARNELVRQPEVNQRLAHVAETRSVASGPRERLAYWIGIEEFSRDLDRVLAVVDIDDLAKRWEAIQWRLETGWPVLGVGIIGGRPGRDTTMRPEAVMLALRSIALRPAARKQLNHERDKGYRGTRQRGHEHAQGAHDHGAIRADELAAAEANKREGRQGRYAIKRAAVTKHRERLHALLREIGP